MVDDFIFSYPVKCGHSLYRYFREKGENTINVFIMGRVTENVREITISDKSPSKFCLQNEPSKTAG